MKEKKILVIFALITVLILGGGVYFLSTAETPPAQITSSKNAKVSVDQKTYDWGKIDYGGGNATKTFKIKNIGTDTLQLTNVKTSCTCTKALVTIDGTESPYFSMHASSGWVGEVKPGKEASLTVIFDPAFHGPSGVGSVTRLISLETNDINSPKLEFTLTGNVVK